MKLVKKINVELNRKGFPKEIDVVQYDTGLQLKCIVKDFDIPNGTTATLYAEKPSGKFVYQQKGIEISDNTIIVDLENQVITEHGKVWMQITLSNGTDTISTFEMLMKVQKSRKDSGAVESTTVIRAFDEAIEKAVAQINEARDDASKYISESVDQSLSIAGKAADAAAVGKKVTELNENLVNDNVFVQSAQDLLVNTIADTVGEKMYVYQNGMYTLTDNGWVDISNGFVYTDGDGKTTDFIPVEPLKGALKVDGRGNLANNFAFYDSSRLFISGVTTIEDTVYIPTNAKFMKFDMSKDNYESFEVYQVTPKVELKQTFENLLQNGEIVDGMKNIYRYGLFPLTYGMYYDISNGVVYTDGDGYAIENYLEINSHNTCLILQGAMGATVVIFYDEDKKYLSGVQTTVSSVAIPSDCKYVRFAISPSDHDSFRLYVEEPIYQIPIDNLEKELPINVRYRYIMTSFSNTEMRLNVFGSTNGVDFYLIDNSYSPKLAKGCVRDPAVAVVGDWFYIVYTSINTTIDGQTGNKIGVCRTKDFRRYEELPLIYLTNPNGNTYKHIWAPTFFEYKNKYYITASVSVQETDTWATDFKCGIAEYDMDTNTCGDVTEVNIAIDNFIDGHFYRFNGYFYLVGKNDDAGTSVVARSTDLLNGEYEILSESMFSNKLEEGQTIIRLDNGKYRMYFDNILDTEKIRYIDFDDINNIKDYEVKDTEFFGVSVKMFHPQIIDFNKPYAFESI